MSEESKVVGHARVTARLPASMMSVGVWLELREDGTTTWKPEDRERFEALSNWRIHG